MKSRKLLALFLAIFMLASMIVPASAETITPDMNDSYSDATTVGYDPALVEEADLTTVPNILDYDTNTSATAYKITSVEGWAKFDALVDAASGGSLLGKTVYLANNLDFEGATITPIGTFQSSNQWNPYSFSGVFDGQGHTIKNVTIEASYTNEVKYGFFGLFSRIAPVYGSECGIKNFIIDSTVKFSFPDSLGLDRSGGGCLIGTIQGTNNNGSWAAVPDVEIYNVCNKADMSYSSRSAAGLIMFAKCCNLIMTNCENQGDLTYTGASLRHNVCSAGIGGLLGSFAEKNAHVGSLNMSNCRNTGNIEVEPETSLAAFSNTISIGGLIGVLNNSTGNTTTQFATISNSINNGNITVSNLNVNSSASYIAGILASYSSSSGESGTIATIDGCINYGSIVINNCGALAKEDAIMPGAYTGIKSTNCVDATGKPDPTYNMVAKYYQMSNKTYKNGDVDSYSLRLVALHNGDLTALDSYSYDVTIKNGDTTVSANTGKLFTVKTSIVADNMGEGATKITNEMLGCDYISAVRIDNIPVSIGEITVTIVPTMTKDGVDTAAAPITFTVDPVVYNA